MAITIKDVAELAGVSYGTVSRVINNRPGVNPKTRAHVLKIIDEVGYQPNAIARSLVTKQSKTIALIVPDISQPFFGSIALSVDQETFKRGYNTVLCNTNYDLEMEKRKLQFVQEKRVDGIIIKPAQEDSTQYNNFKIPTVLISHIDEEHSNYIDIENIQGGYIAGKHIAECGYENIAFIGGYENATSTKLRLKGFQKGLKEQGVELDSSFIRFGNYSIKNGYNSLQKMIDEKKVPGAVFCGNDLIAFGVLQKAEEEGIKVPEELGVVGFDDGVMAALPQIKLTTVAQPAEKMGRLATEMLISMIDKSKNHQPQNITLEPELKIRATTCNINL